MGQNKPPKWTTSECQNQYNQRVHLHRTNGKVWCVMSEKPDQLDALSAILGILQSLSVHERRRIIETVLTFFASERRAPHNDDVTASTLPLFDISPNESNKVPFSVRLDVTPKEFLLQKKPKTD